MTSLIDPLEVLEVVGVGVQRLLEGLDRLGARAELLRQDVAGGHEVRAARGTIGQLGQPREQLDRLLPLLGLGVELEQTMHDRPLVRPDLERLQIGGDRALGIVPALLMDGGHVLEESELGLRIVGDRQQRLRVAHDGVVVAGRARRLDQRLERPAAPRIERQRLLQRLERAGRAPARSQRDPQAARRR